MTGRTRLLSAVSRLEAADCVLGRVYVCASVNKQFVQVRYLKN